MVPMARLLPLRVRLALDAESGALPRMVLPSEKVTLPVGAEVPLVFTVAVSSVEAVDAMEEGLAVTKRVVVTRGAITVMAVELPEPRKFPVGV